MVFVMAIKALRVWLSLNCNTQHTSAYGLQ